MTTEERVQQLEAELKRRKEYAALKEREKKAQQELFKNSKTGKTLKFLGILK